MKNTILFLLILCLFVSCEEDHSVDITVMPEETSVGANTFGCLIDGWLYVGGRYSDYNFWLWQIEQRESIQFTYIDSPDEESKMEVSVICKPDKILSFTILALEEGENCKYVNTSLNGEHELPSGEAYITRFDTTNKIISGRFGGGKVTEGRFDVIYYNQNEGWN